MVLFAPWPFGCTEAVWEFALFAGLSLAQFAFGVWLITGERVEWHGGQSGLVIIAGMLGLAAVAALQLVDLPISVVSMLAPGVEFWTTAHDSAGKIAMVDASGVNEAERWFAGSKIGLNAGGSFQFMIRILTAAWLFGMICFFHRPDRTLRRLSVAAVLVGTALALFGIAQYFGSHDRLAYWMFEIKGGLGFGPFVNRNHYPFFLNLSLGLTIGLLMERLESMGRHWHLLILADVAATWLLVAMVFMIASLVICVSRGGLISGFLAFCIVMMMRFSVSGVKRSLVVGFSVAVPTIVLLIWVGFDFYESRLVMLSDAEKYTGDGRWILWRAAWQSVPEFPWFGSGGETYRYWETIYVTGSPHWTSETNRSVRADNEIIDVLNEYGIAGLCSLLMMFAGLAWVAITSARRNPLSAGASIGILAVLMHSLVDFGLRIPSTGTFAVIVAGLLSSQPRFKSTRHSRKKGEPTGPRMSDGVYRTLACVGAVLLIACTLYTLSVKRRYYAAERAKKVAYELLKQSMTEDAMIMMNRAVVSTPEDLLAHFEFARSCQSALDLTDSPELKTKLIQLINLHSAVTIELCPLLWEPNVWLAQYGRHQESDQERLEDLLWARTLHPGDSNLAFLAGTLEQQENDLSAAIPHWRESLTYSTKHLSQILTFAETELSPDEIVERLLPADPVVTFEAALYFDRKKGSDVRDQCVRRTQQLLATPSATKRRLDEGTLHEMQSRCYGMLGKPEESIHSLRLALNHAPTKVAWRIQLARRLMESRQLDAAIREVRIVLTLDPNAREGLALQKQLSVLRASSNPSR